MEILEFLKTVHDQSIRLSENIKFDKTHPRHLHLVGLYGTLIEITGSIVTLIESKNRTGVPPLFRSMLEAYVELKNLHEKAEYGYYMQASYLDQWLKVLKEARDKPNPYLKDIARLSNLDAEIARNEAELASLKTKGYSPLTVFERFQKAGMVPEYRSLYNFLSNDAHSNIRALVDRHLEIKGNEFQVVFYKDEPLEGFVIYVDSATSMLVDASKKIHEFFQTGFLPQIQALDDKLTQIRSRY